MREKEDTLRLIENKVYLGGVLLQCTPIMRENIFSNFDSGERVKVDFHDNGYVKSMVLMGEKPDIQEETVSDG
jgi:hypothetical protein